MNMLLTFSIGRVWRASFSSFAAIRAARLVRLDLRVGFPPSLSILLLFRKSRVTATRIGRYSSWLHRGHSGKFRVSSRMMYTQSHIYTRVINKTTNNTWGDDLVEYQRGFWKDWCPSAFRLTQKRASFQVQACSELVIYMAVGQEVKQGQKEEEPPNPVSDQKLVPQSLSRMDVLKNL